MGRRIATGTAERTAAEEMIVRHRPAPAASPSCADNGYDAAAFIAEMRSLNVTPHIAQNVSVFPPSTRAPRDIPARPWARRSKSASKSHSAGKTIGGLSRPMLREVRKLGFKFALTIRLPKRPLHEHIRGIRNLGTPSITLNKHYQAGFKSWTNARPNYEFQQPAKAPKD